MSLTIIDILGIIEIFLFLICAFIVSQKPRFDRNRNVIFDVISTVVIVLFLLDGLFLFCYDTFSFFRGNIRFVIREVLLLCVYLILFIIFRKKLKMLHRYIKTAIVVFALIIGYLIYFIK